MFVDLSDASEYDSREAWAIALDKSTFTNLDEMTLDRETLLQAIEHGPVRLTMNDGSSYEISSLRDVAVDSTTCYLMKRGDDGRYRAVWLALVCMTKVEQLSVAS